MISIYKLFEAEYKWTKIKAIAKLLNINNKEAVKKTKKYTDDQIVSRYCKAIQYTATTEQKIQVKKLRVLLKEYRNTKNNNINYQQKLF